MSLTIGKRDVTKIARVLEQPYETAEEAAQAVLEAAFELYEQKAKWTVVGQLYYSDHKWLDPEDAAASKVALGRYGTQTQAEAAAASLVFSHQTGEEFRAWALPVHHGTPASYFKERLEERKARELGEKSALEIELQRRSEFFARNPGVLTLPESWEDDEECDGCACTCHDNDQEEVDGEGLGLDRGGRASA